MSFLFYEENLRFLQAVTDMLNKNMPDIYGIKNSGYHIHVELREDETFRKVGEWSDEIGPDCWSIELKTEEE